VEGAHVLSVQHKPLKVLGHITPLLALGSAHRLACTKPKQAA
jgi:hypothetical protein